MKIKQAATNNMYHFSSHSGSPQMSVHADACTSELNGRKPATKRNKKNTPFSPLITSTSTRMRGKKCSFNFPYLGRKKITTHNFLTQLSKSSYPLLFPDQISSEFLCIFQQGLAFLPVRPDTIIAYEVDLLLYPLVEVRRFVFKEVEVWCVFRRMFIDDDNWWYVLIRKGKFFLKIFMR